VRSRARRNGYPGSLPPARAAFDAGEEKRHRGGPRRAPQAAGRGQAGGRRHHGRGRPDSFSIRRASVRRATEGSSPSSSSSSRSNSLNWRRAGPGWAAAARQPDQVPWPSSRSGSTDTACRAWDRAPDRSPYCIQIGDERARRVEKQPGEPLLLGRDPLLVVARQEASLVQVDGARQGLRSHRRAPRPGCVLRACSNSATSRCHRSGI
jgi:hypothetical protein